MSDFGSRSDKCKFLTRQSFRTYQDKARVTANKLMNQCEIVASEGNTRWTVTCASNYPKKVFTILIENGFNVVPKQIDSVVISW
jgi:hypothetical protein